MAAICFTMALWISTQSLKVSGGIAVGNACDDEQKEDNGDQALSNGEPEYERRPSAA